MDVIIPIFLGALGFIVLVLTIYYKDNKTSKEIRNKVSDKKDELVQRFQSSSSKLDNGTTLWNRVLRFKAETNAVSIDKFLKRDTPIWPYIKNTRVVFGGVEFSEYDAKNDIIFIGESEKKTKENIIKLVLRGAQAAVCAQCGWQYQDPYGEGYLMKITFGDVDNTMKKDDKSIVNEPDEQIIFDNLNDNTSDTDEEDDDDENLLDTTNSSSIDEFEKPIELVGRTVISGTNFPDDYQIEPKVYRSGGDGERECPSWYTSIEDYCNKIQKNYDNDEYIEKLLICEIKFKVMQEHGFGFSSNDPIGYFRVNGKSILHYVLSSYRPAIGADESWNLAFYFRVGHFQNGIDKYVVLYTGYVNGDYVGYLYEMYFWPYDKKSFEGPDYKGVRRLPNNFKSSYEDETLLNSKNNLYGSPGVFSRYRFNQANDDYLNDPLIRIGRPVIKKKAMLNGISYAMPGQNLSKLPRSKESEKHNLYRGDIDGEQKTSKPAKRTVLTPKDEIADEKKINDKEKLIAVLEKLETELHDKDGYNLATIMTELDVVECFANADKIHDKLCKMIDKKIYPDIKIAGDENIICPIAGNSEGTTIYTFGLVKYRIQGKIILGEWVRKNTVNLDNIAKAGICKCWVNHETFEKILHYKNLSYDEIKDKTETRQDWFCVFVGRTDDMSNRIKQHVNGSLSSSAMKRNLAGILKDKNLLEDIIDGINFECIATEQGEKVKEDSLKKYVYILYKDN